MFHNYLEPSEIINKRTNYMFPCSQFFYKNPPHLVKGSMQYLFDHQGNKYLDFFSGVSVMNCGHSNPDILSATIQQLQSLQHTTTIYLNESIANLAEALAGVYPGNIKRSFFCCTGSEANEGALLLARLHTKKKYFIALDNSLHGRTNLTMNATGLPMWRTDPYLEDTFYFVPSFHGIGEEKERNAKNSIAKIRELLEEKSHEIAAMIIEPIQGNGGILTPPIWYFDELKQLLEEYHVLLICDEIQTGFGRTGEMFAIQNFKVVPDILTVAKALGNGIPISAFATTDTIAASFTRPSASTFGGNPVASETGLAVLNYINKHQLVEKSKKLGTLLKNQLLRLQEKHNIIADIRGMGLMQGLELMKDNQPASSETDRILEDMKNRGFIIGKNGLHRNVIALQPPLIIEEEDIEVLVKNLDEVL